MTLAHCKCGETDPMKFYPSNRWICKLCHQAMATWKKRTPEQRHKVYIRRKAKALEEARRSRARHRDVINMRQREQRRNEARRLLDRLSKESSRIIGRPRMKLTKVEMKTLLYIRLFKLCLMGTLSREAACKVIAEFDGGNHLDALLNLYRYKTLPGILPRETVHNQYKG